MKVSQSCLTLCEPSYSLPGPLSMGFSRQEHWGGQPFPSPGVFPTQGSNPGLLHRRQILYRLSESSLAVPGSLRPHGLYSPWRSPGQNTGVGSLSLLQGIFPTQGLNPGLPHSRQFLYQLSHKWSPLYHLNWSEVKSLSRVRLFATLWTVAYQAPLSMGFSRQEYLSGSPFPSPGDLPDPGTEPGSPAL